MVVLCFLSYIPDDDAKEKLINDFKERTKQREFLKFLIQQAFMSKSESIYLPHYGILGMMTKIQLQTLKDAQDYGDEMCRMFDHAMYFIGDDEEIRQMMDNAEKKTFVKLEKESSNLDDDSYKYYLKNKEN